MIEMKSQAKKDVANVAVPNIPNSEDFNVKQTNIKKQRNFFSSVKAIINEYLGMTSIHGLRYLRDSRNIVEKVSWLIIICMSFGFCFHIIQSHFSDIDKKPILTTVEMVSVQEVPFPAVTIRQFCITFDHIPVVKRHFQGKIGKKAV